MQGAHLDVDAALYALVHRWHAQEERNEQPGAAAVERRVPRPRQPGTQPGRAARPGAAAGPRTLPVPRHRIGPVIQALLLLGRRKGPAVLSHQLADLIEALDRLSARTDPAAGAADAAPGRDGAPGHDARWWAVRLLSETLLRVPDARPYLGVLRLLAGRVVRRAACGGPGARGRTPRSGRGSGGG